MDVPEPETPIALRDSTLREGMDVPGVSFSPIQRLRIAEALAAAGVAEAEVVAPSRVLDDVAIAREIAALDTGIRLSGPVYATGPDWQAEAQSAADGLDRVDLLMPLSGHREPRDLGEKATRLSAALHDLSLSVEVGAGFPHATQVEPDAVVELALLAAEAGAARITLYDTNGSAEPFQVRELVARVVARVRAPVFFHAHNDLGLATANSWAASLAGAAGLDVTVNGLGDRAGNASLEQLVVLLGQRGSPTGVDASALPGLSQLVEELSGVPVPGLAPVVGRHAFEHKSPTHLDDPAQFEGLDPKMVGRERRTAVDTPPAGT